MNTPSRKLAGFRRRRGKSSGHFGSRGIVSPATGPARRGWVMIGLLCFASVTTAQSPVTTAQDPVTKTQGPAKDAPGLAADGFAIEATTRVDGQTTDRHRILFAAGIAYDVMGDGSRFLAIYDSSGVTLLDRREQTRTFIHHRAMIDATAEAEAAAARSPNAARFGLKIRPEVQDDVYSASFGPFTYEIRCDDPAEDFISGDYARFADAAARLNLLRARGFPPFARLTLNRQIALDGRLPVETVVSVRGDTRVQTFVCSHVRTGLSMDDRQWIDRLENMKQLFTSIPLDRFDRVEAVAVSPSETAPAR